MTKRIDHRLRLRDAAEQLLNAVTRQIDAYTPGTVNPWFMGSKA